MSTTLNSSMAEDKSMLQEINAACLRFTDSSHQEFSALRQSVDNQTIGDAETGK
jgi:hypothetical protein